MILIIIIHHILQESLKVFNNTLSSICPKKEAKTVISSLFSFNLLTFLLSVYYTLMGIANNFNNLAHVRSAPIDFAMISFLIEHRRAGPVTISQSCLRYSILVQTAVNSDN